MRSGKITQHELYQILQEKAGVLGGVTSDVMNSLVAQLWDRSEHMFRDYNSLELNETADDFANRAFNLVEPAVGLASTATTMTKSVFNKASSAYNQIAEYLHYDDISDTESVASELTVTTSISEVGSVVTANTVRSISNEGIKKIAAAMLIAEEGEGVKMSAASAGGKEVVDVLSDVIEKIVEKNSKMVQVPSRGPETIGKMPAVGGPSSDTRPMMVEQKFTGKRNKAELDMLYGIGMKKEEDDEEDKKHKKVKTEIPPSHDYPLSPLTVYDSDE